MAKALRLSRRIEWIAAGIAVAAWAATALADQTLPTADDPAGRHMYFSNGVHNDLGCPTPTSCTYPRKPGEPQQDPKFPTYWTSDWKMYRVFRKYQELPPPYASPPAGMTPSDYEVSNGTTYYDSTYVPPDNDGAGAMLEYYDKRCLPIFTGSNQFSCAFVSLGNKAYFLRYDDRPAGTPLCCQFSLQNHPPAPDFVKHLPYNAQQSSHIGGSVQRIRSWSRPGRRRSCSASRSRSRRAATTSIAARRRSSTRSRSSSPASRRRRPTRR